MLRDQNFLLNWLQKYGYFSIKVIRLISKRERDFADPYIKTGKNTKKTIFCGLYLNAIEKHVLNQMTFYIEPELNDVEKIIRIWQDLFETGFKTA